jgi:hypothetical protein
MKTIWLILLLTFSLPVSAAEWVRVQTSGEADQYYYDRSKLFINGDEITYWKKGVFKAAQPVKNQFAASGLYRERIHCAEHTLKLISYLLYAADGSTIEYVAANEGDAAPIIPDTLGDIFERTTCELVRLKHLEQRRKLEETQKAEPKKEDPQRQGVAPPLPAPTPGDVPQPVAPPVVQKVEPPPVAPSEDTRPASKEN